VKSKLEELKRLVDGGWQRESVALMERARKKLVRTTPRSKKRPEPEHPRAKRNKARRDAWKGDRHLADGWTLRSIGRGGKDRVPVVSVVYNRFTHLPTGRVRKKAVVGAGHFSEGYTVLDILEYGSRAHPIRPTGTFAGAKKGLAKWLYFWSDREGDFVFARRVEHPGTPPRGMVRVASAWLHRRVAKLQRKWKRKMEKAWRK
jgi:hypothetical protein